MGQDLKCALGMHKLEIQDTLEVKSNSGVVGCVIGTNFVCRCKNCGKIKAFFVPTTADYINRSTKA